MSLDGRTFSDRDAYALGLWCADGYHRSSSIGLSNTNVDLVYWFGAYLASLLGGERLKLRAYVVDGSPIDSRIMGLVSGRVSRCRPFKMKQTAYHIYVNSRPLLRLFRDRRRNISSIPRDRIPSYLAGRFDGDGSVGTSRVPGIRIVYSSRAEADTDAILTNAIGISSPSVYEYSAAREWCVYVPKEHVRFLLQLISPFSLRL